MYTVPPLFDYRRLLWVGVVKLTANFACVDWLFRGTEQFRYITARSILVKFLYVVAVFVFVRKADDYIIYYFVSSLMWVGNALVNIVFARKVISVSFRGLNISRYLKPYLTLGLYAFLSSMYITFNVTYLGFATDNVQVGYYTTASKIHSIIIAFFTAFTGVMLPRMSSLLSEGRDSDFRLYISKSFNLLLLFAVPVVIFTCVAAPEIIQILAGSGYEGAVLPARIIMPLILIIGFEQIFVIQILMPLRCDREVLINSFAGAVLGVVLILLLVRQFKAVGSALVWISCELLVLILASMFSRKRAGIAFPFREMFRMILHYVPAAAVALTLELCVGSMWLRFALVCLWMACYTAVYVLFIKKDEIVISFINRIISYRL